MNLLFRLIWLFWGKQALVRETKRRALATYLRAIRATRFSVILFLAAFLSLQLMMLAGVGALVTGIYLWDYDFQKKVELLFWIFASLFFLPAGALCILLSERLWFKLSGARRLMDDLSNR